MGWVVLACVTSVLVGFWIGWMARTTKYMLETRDQRRWDHRQRAMDAMSPRS